MIEYAELNKVLKIILSSLILSIFKNEFKISSSNWFVFLSSPWYLFLMNSKLFICLWSVGKENSSMPYIYLLRFFKFCKKFLYLTYFLFLPVFEVSIFCNFFSILSLISSYFYSSILNSSSFSPISSIFSSWSSWD